MATHSSVFAWRIPGTLCEQSRTRLKWLSSSIIFIHVSVDGPLDWSLVLAIVNITPVNIRLRVWLRFRVFTWYVPRSCISGSYVSSLCVALRNYHTVFHSSCNVYISINRWEGSLFFTPFPVFAICKLFDDGHSNWCELLPHCSFDLHFSDN